MHGVRSVLGGERVEMNTEVEGWRMMLHRGFSCVRIVTMMVVALAMFAVSAAAFHPGGDEGFPATSIVPAGAESGTAPASSPASAYTPAGAPAITGPARSKPAKRHRPATATVHETEVEPAQARLKLIEDTWVYSTPSKKSKQLEHVIKDKYVIVTGSTHNYLQVKLKDGQTGYLDPAAVSLVSPADQVFVLTHDASVLDQPNRFGKKLAEVHKSKNVHVVGLALNYMKIRMKNGLQGYIPITALE
jgi:hypothetical protein